MARHAKRFLVKQFITSTQEVKVWATSRVEAKQKAANEFDKLYWKDAEFMSIDPPRRWWVEELPE